MGICLETMAEAHAAELERGARSAIPTLARCLDHTAEAQATELEGGARSAIPALAHCLDHTAEAQVSELERGTRSAFSTQADSHVYVPGLPAEAPSSARTLSADAEAKDLACPCQPSAAVGPMRPHPANH